MLIWGCIIRPIELSGWVHTIYLASLSLGYFLREDRQPSFEALLAGALYAAHLQAYVHASGDEAACERPVQGRRENGVVQSIDAGSFWKPV